MRRDPRKLTCNPCPLNICLNDRVVKALTIQISYSKRIDGTAWGKSHGGPNQLLCAFQILYCKLTGITLAGMYQKLTWKKESSKTTLAAGVHHLAMTST
jgi:hypothetical protein